MKDFIKDHSIQDPQDRPGTPEEALKLGLNEGEFDLILQKIGRNPTFTELAMFSGMWSEHCSYKNSILLLKELYCESDRLLAARGEENAGALKINDQQAVVFKIESHNHPSAIEPYQGAATGVGGIMRDVFTMGARPLVSLNSLRFGMPDDPKNKHLLREVVRGIGNYGNSLGIPCGGGEIYFHDTFSTNPLVNAMTVGIADSRNLASSRASGLGNLVLYVGAKTGRDGIHGASFASKNLSTESAEERSAVQVGDPFMEKLLMEATLECIKENLVVAVQDMGAAGLLSSSSEMSSSGGVGMDLFLERVPAREEKMEPFEFLLSESQERMLMVIEPKNLANIEKIFKKWELDCEQIGIITDTKNLRVFFRDKLYANLPARVLTVNQDGAPRYKREVKKPALKPKDPKLNLLNFFEQCLSEKDSGKAQDIIMKMLSSPNFAGRKVVYEQYDTDIGNMRIIGPGKNGGLYRVPGTDQAIAVTVDGNSFYVAIDPYGGARHTVAEAYRNIVSTGATPIGISNCLNFANPYIPENFYFFEQAVTGMSDAARFLKIPITGGNVSFYNESEQGPVLPTPTIGMVGLLDDTKNAVSISLEDGSSVYLTGFFKPALGVSQYALTLTGNFDPTLPELDLEKEVKTADAVLKAIHGKLALAAIDLSFGGTMMALLKMLLSKDKSLNDKNLGLDGFIFNHDRIEQYLAETKLSPDQFFWGESAHCYLLGVKDGSDFEKLMQEKNIPFLNLGKTAPEQTIRYNSLSFDLPALEKAYANGLSQYFF